MFSFIFLLNDLKKGKHFTWFGRAFHTSGPWCLRDLWANKSLGLLRWMLLRVRVGYEWTFLLYWKKFLNTWGRTSFVYLNMNIAVCRVFISWTLRILRRRNKGSVCVRYDDFVQILTAFFVKEEFDLVLSYHSFPILYYSNLYKAESLCYKAYKEISEAIGVLFCRVCQFLLL